MLWIRHELLLQSSSFERRQIRLEIAFTFHSWRVVVRVGDGFLDVVLLVKAVFVLSNHVHDVVL